MTEKIHHVHDPAKLAHRLKRLSNGFRLFGYGMLLLSLASLIAYRATGPLVIDTYIGLLIVIGAVGLSVLVCGHLLWRVLYGGSPDVFADHERPEN